jgi:hypothetical protein
MDIRRSLVLEPPKSNAIPYPLQDLVLTGNDEGLSLKLTTTMMADGAAFIGL